MTEQEKRAEEQVEDLDVPESESELVKGGDTKKPKTTSTTKDPQYLEVKLENTIVSNY